MDPTVSFVVVKLFNCISSRFRSCQVTATFTVFLRDRFSVVFWKRHEFFSLTVTAIIGTFLETNKTLTKTVQVDNFDSKLVTFTQVTGITSIRPTVEKFDNFASEYKRMFHEQIRSCF